jgi:hypothetical protein
LPRRLCVTWFLPTFQAYHILHPTPCAPETLLSSLCLHLGTVPLTRFLHTLVLPSEMLFPQVSSFREGSFSLHPTLQTLYCAVFFIAHCNSLPPLSVIHGFHTSTENCPADTAKSHTVPLPTSQPELHLLCIWEVRQLFVKRICYFTARYVLGIYSNWLKQFLSCKVS